ncbi:MFS transporter [Phytohalomonas tamaricis]|uniref:MFS transporter n=1 Tax=Phytohalomonas tamaricis TaxID=2081032 RepID=UPI0021D42ABE|nr:MFS transporter [Phytohalomonas tamaricis]
MPDDNKELSLNHAYEWLTGDSDGRTCKDIPEDACHEQPGNFLRQLLASLGNKLADEMASARLILPWLMGAIGAPVWMIGLLVPLREAGALLPQLIVAGLIRPLPRRKYVWALGSLMQCLCAALLALLAVFGQGGWGGALVLATLALLSLARGVASIATKDVLGKTIDKQHRGALLGWSGSLAGAATLIAGAVLVLFDDRPSQLALAALLAIAALGWGVNALFSALIREVPGATEGGENAWRTLVRGGHKLQEDRDFRRFNLCRALLLSSALALPYIALLGQGKSGSNLKGLGILIILSGLASMIASPIWGRLADRSSKNVMRDAGLGAAICCALTALCAWLPFAWTATIWPYAVLYALLVIAHAGIRLGRKTYVIDLASQQERALYVALSNTLTGGLLLMLGAAAGALAHWLGSAAVLTILAVTMLCAAGLAHRLHEVEQ